MQTDKEMSSSYPHVKREKTNVSLHKQIKNVESKMVQWVNNRQSVVLRKTIVIGVAANK